MQSKNPTLRSSLRLAPLFLVLFASFFGAEDASAANPWLRTVGNRIYDEDGRVWAGVGANIHDTRSCNACTNGPPNVDEVKRRIDELVDVWGASFLRLDLESYGSSSVLNSPQYLADIVEIVDHIATKPGAYVLLSLWIDPSFTDLGWPTAGTRDVWRKLADTFGDDSHVMYGLVNEPQHNYDGAHNAAVWTAMNDAVAAIRDVETSKGDKRHIITVQGVGGWARFLGYYVDHPITAGGGKDIAYEVHVYDPASSFGDRFEDPSLTLPVIIGEYGPIHGMSMQDCSILQQRAFELKIPILAWTFHMRCPPNLIVDNSNGGCGVDMPLEPTAWGNNFKDHLAMVNAAPVPAPTVPPLNPPPPPPPVNEPPAEEPPADEPPVDEPPAEEPPAEEPPTEEPPAEEPPAEEPPADETNRGPRPIPVPAVDASPLDPVSEKRSPPKRTYVPEYFRVLDASSDVWVEVEADAKQVKLELESGERVELQRTAKHTFGAHVPLASGTTVRFHLRRGRALAQTEWFGWLTEAPQLANSNDVWVPAIRFRRQASPVWPALTANADEVYGTLRTGETFAFVGDNGTFVAERSPLKRGTHLRLTVMKDGETVKTKWFRYLIQQPMVD